jgi:hypothetical protein
VLDYVVSSRVEGVASSPEWVVVSLGWCLGPAAWVTGGSERFHATNPGGSRTAQVLSELVLQFSVLIFLFFEEKEEKRKGKKKKKRKNYSGSWQLQHLGFWGCFVL